ncbi:Calcineurin-like phosphoesterase superfamily domain-containing protein [Paramicrobacterium humi]|uniref:Calcineurin-like phosphoesterase superfamily domain-containing protein n=1 Tax=Paramicrobacterium humi TaxID=640635 RepID=A0A1H4LU79_9MICO|nr:metallophosphoesterase [Microbacterium humi]SEB74148.1 Calcineurin-like phosphoesterase superfamily domain-containing protein [Microbacterium humi]
MAMILRRELRHANRVGLLGDVHADLNHVLAATGMLNHKGIKLVVQLGDFGFVWNGPGREATLDRLDQFLHSRAQTLLFLDGNHEDFDLLESFPISSDGVRWIRDYIGHLPRGYRTRLISGHSLAVLGGANSIDVGYRQRGSSWWEQEQITDEDDLARLGTQHADVLLSHDAPLHVPALDATLRSADKYWPPRSLAYARAGRRMFHKGFLQVRPQLSIGGHYHQFIDATVDYELPDGAFTSRVIVLDEGGTFRGNCAILTLPTLDIEVFDVEGRPYPERDDDDEQE